MTKAAVRRSFAIDTHERGGIFSNRLIVMTAYRLPFAHVNLLLEARRDLVILRFMFICTLSTKRKGFLVVGIYFHFNSMVSSMFSQSGMCWALHSLPEVVTM